MAQLTPGQLTEQFSNAEKVEFWRRYRSKISEYQFPRLASGTEGDERHHVIRSTSVTRSIVEAFCEQICVSMPTVFKLAWAIVLKCYVGDRQAAFNVIFHDWRSDLAGLCLTLLNNELSVVETLQRMQADSMACFPYYTTSLSGIWDEECDVLPAFNTILCLEITGRQRDLDRLVFEGLSATFANVRHIPIV